MIRPILRSAFRPDLNPKHVLFLIGAAQPPIIGRGSPSELLQAETLKRVVVVIGMVRRRNARRIGLDEKQSAKMYPASSGERSPGA